MTTQHTCDSCGMPIEDGTYCEYCTDTDGNLQSFDERFERMVQWTMKRGNDLSRTKAEEDTLAYMATMPAWRNHPRVKAATSD
jgi:hypothetical protein